MMKKAGFSLVEMVLVIVVMGILASVAAIGFQPVLDSWVIAGSRAKLTNAATYALNRVIGEISEIRNRQSVFTANANTLEFDDADGNRITFSLSGGSLLRNSAVLARGVQSFSLSYWDVNHATLASPQVSPLATDLWRIRVQLTVQEGSQQVALESQVHPRNFARP